MECNKDEAVRAKEIAERKYREKDYLGARKFALKAQKLYPNLEGLAQMVMTLDVYISADTRVGKGTVDWYSVLGVSPRADDDTIRKQYKKLVLLLHPDKNKTLGADGAFKLVSDAWCFLSDKTKRSNFNRELNLPDPEKKPPKAANTGPPKANGCGSYAPFSPLFSKTFWTMCLKCQTYYEYMRIYLNQNLQCPNCREAFLAIEKDPPPNIPKPKNQNTKPFGFCMPPAYPNSRPMKRENDGAFPPSKRKKIDEALKNFFPANGAVLETSVSIKPKWKRDLTPSQLREMLQAKAKRVIMKLLEEWATKEAAKRGKDDSPQQSNSGSFSPENPPGSDPESVVITVPDSDFHSFDSDRTENSFADDQVWAAYDENDQMPRYYAKIHKVLSEKPFKLKFSWLNSRNNAEFSSLEWVSSGFLKTCGDFRPGKHEMTETLNSFSHVVKWKKGPRGVITILPEKGDVWALYKNWSADWNEETPEEEVNQYEVVEVLSEYDEGISVHLLEKVAGYKTVFDRRSDTCSKMRIPKEEMFRFSHQVPFRVVTGEEREGAPKGCKELDPAAIPLELLEDGDDAKADGAQ